MFEDIFEKIIIPVLIGFSVVLCLLVICLPFVLFYDYKIDNKYIKGEISLPEYCDEKTNKGTQSDVPVICYEYYHVKQVGEKTECSGKVCRSVPVLKSN